MRKELATIVQLVFLAILSVSSMAAVAVLASLLAAQGKRLREAERPRARLSDLAAGSADALAGLDAAGAVMEANNSFLSMVGASSLEDIRGKRLASFFKDPEVSAAIAAGAERFEALLEREGREGSPVEIELNAAPVAAEIVRVATLRDASAGAERDRVREQLAIAQKMEATAQVAGAIAYKFTDALTGIMGNLSIIKIMHESGAGADPREDYAGPIKMAMESCARAGLMARGLLDFSGQEASGSETFDLGAVLGQIAGICKSSFPRAIEVSFSEPERAFPVKADRAQVEQALVNVCTNAAQAMASRGGSLALGIRAVTPDPRLPGLFPLVEPDLLYARLTVADTGMGMDRSTLRQIFEPFYSTKEGDGSGGLGMAIVYSTMKRCGGSVDVDSLPGRGTTVSLYFPLVKDAPADSLAGPGPGIVEGEGRVVLVSDDPQERMVLAGMVRICGYEALECSAPDEAIAALASGHEGTVALIASRAGPLSAVECYESLVRSSPGLKFLIIAAADGAELAIKAMRLPSDIVLKRPFSVQKLSARLAEAFNPLGSA